MKNQADNLPLITTGADKKLSKLQADFNAKIKRISELKESIVNVKQQSIEINQRLEKELTPIQKQRTEAHRALILAFVDASYNMKMSKTDKEILEEYIIHELWNLIEHQGQTDLIEIYDQLSKKDFKTELNEIKKEQEDTMFKMFKKMTGFGLDDFDLGPDADDLDPIARIHRLKAAVEEKMEKEQQEKKEKQDKKKKTTKQASQEENLRQEAQMLTKSSRAIYLELAKELHPDRELDEQKRIWKTEIMQRITVAYNDNDLYELLSLRLEYIQNQTDAQEVPEKQLELYIKILKDQISALNQEYQMLFAHGNPNTARVQEFGLGKAKHIVTRMINKAKKEILEEMSRMNYTKSNALQSPQNFKQYMKNQRNIMEYEDFDPELISTFFNKK